MANIQAALVRSILEKWQHYEWTVQGFGFIRTKIADVGRIHVWDSRLTTPLVSTAHTHPWPLKSTIISGELINQRFTSLALNAPERRGLPYVSQDIATGEGGHLIGDPQDIWLYAQSGEIYHAGDSYSQEAEEIHRSIPQDGTVTLLERPQGPPLEKATVYWPRGGCWGTAEPRKPEPYQVGMVVSYALARWYTG